MTYAVFYFVGGRALDSSRKVVLYPMVSLGEFAANLRDNAVWGVVSMASVGIDVLCLGIWIACLDRSGERRTVVVPQAWTPGARRIPGRAVGRRNEGLLRAGPR